MKKTDGRKSRNIGPFKLSWQQAIIVQRISAETIPTIKNAILNSEKAFECRLCLRMATRAIIQ
jgi:hypothetical protein